VPCYRGRWASCTARWPRAGRARRRDGGRGVLHDLFSYERGEATIFVPTGAQVARWPVVPVVVPAVELATTVHAGPHADIDRAYGALVPT